MRFRPKRLSDFNRILVLGINIDDVKTVIGLMRGHLIALAVCLVLAIVVTVAAVKLSKGKKLVRGNAWLAFVLAVIIILNLILTGPVYSIVNLAMGGGSISEKSIDSATELCTAIAEEGIVLLKNEDSILPLKNTKINTFGWSATNPVYGGTGSGSLSGAYPTVTLLEGLPTWQILLYVADVLVIALLALWEVKLIKNYKKAGKETTVETVSAEEE